MTQQVRSYSSRVRADDQSLFVVNASDFQRVVADCDAAAADLALELRNAMDAFGKDIAQQAKSIAPVRTKSASRIPRTIKVQRRGLKVKVLAGGNDAPHGGLFERGSKDNPNKIRWPFFGDTENWYEMATRPFLQPAYERVEPRMMEFLAEITDRAVRTKSVFE